MIFKSWNRLLRLHTGFLAYLLVNMGQLSSGYHQPEERLVEVHEDLAGDLGEVLHRDVQQSDALAGGEDGELRHQPSHHLGLLTRHGDTAVTSAMRFTLPCTYFYFLAFMDVRRVYID